MKEIDTLESQISELTMKVTLEDDVKKRRLNEKLLQKFNEGLEERHTALQGTEKEIDDLSKDKVWLDWIAGSYYLLLG